MLNRVGRRHLTANTFYCGSGRGDVDSEGGWSCGHGEADAALGACYEGGGSGSVPGANSVPRMRRPLEVLESFSGFNNQCTLSPDHLQFFAASADDESGVCSLEG